jgi:hypothetical protein
MRVKKNMTKRVSVEALPILPQHPRTRDLAVSQEEERKNMRIITPPVMISMHFLLSLSKRWQKSN